MYFNLEYILLTYTLIQLLFICSHLAKGLSTLPVLDDIMYEFGLRVTGEIEITKRTWGVKTEVPQF